ncbi:acyl-CoA-like ligand-binding transcription factor [Streptomyces sp. YIM S03343]
MTKTRGGGFTAAPLPVPAPEEKSYGLGRPRPLGVAGPFVPEEEVSAMPPVPGLRERKKMRVRKDIRREAIRLFIESGYDGTTIEQIAEAAEVSPSTFFRYFPTKEHVVFADEYDPALQEAISSRPETEPVLVAVRNGIVELCRTALSAEQDELLVRMQLIDRVPALRSRLPQHQRDESGFIATFLAQRLGRRPDDVEIRVLVGMLGSMVAEVLLDWARTGGERSLEEMFVTLFDHLAEIFTPVNADSSS